MTRFPLASLIALAGFVRAAEVVPPATPPSSGSIETSSVEQAKKGPPKRTVSPDTAAKLAAAAPKFTAPAPPAEQAPLKEPVSPVTRETDPPRNQVIQMPEFVVGEPKERLPTPLEVLTPKGRVELAFNRRPGLKLVPFAWMNAGIAMEMLEEDLQAQRRREAVELLSLYLIR
jgi:hypothetical protein